MIFKWENFEEAITVVKEYENFECCISSRKNLQEVQGVEEVCGNGKGTWF